MERSRWHLLAASLTLSPQADNLIKYEHMFDFLIEIRIVSVIIFSQARTEMNFGG